MKREIPGYEGLYAADETGTIWSLCTTQSRREGPLKPYRNTGGYLRVNLFKGGKVRHEYVHRMVASAFIPNPENLPVVNHKDADPTNNSVDNLEWCTQKQNIAASRDMGHQNKDRSVLAVSTTTWAVRCYPNMRAAGLGLFGRYWALQYAHKTKGPRFQLGEWLIEVGA